MPVAEPQTTNTAFVGRQAIFQPNLHVHGYELLFRGGDQSGANVQDGDHATASVLMNSLTAVGFDVVTDSRLAFINLTRNLLLDADFSCLPRERVVLEVLEDIEPDDAVLGAIRNLADEGYTIALDDFVYRTELEPLIELADIVKIEFPEIPPDELAEHIRILRDLGVKTILAEKLETFEEFEVCNQLKCDLFQGYFFCRPQVLKQRRVPGNIASVVDLLSSLQDPDLTLADVEAVIQTDANLSYKVLRFVNSADVAARNTIESISHATALLGVRRLRSLASMMLLASLSDEKPEELIKTAMIRARLCELIAERAGYEGTSRFYTLGLLSVMDAMLDMTMEEVLVLLPLATEMNEALQHHKGELGTTLKHAITIESGGECPAEYYGAYAEALQWSAKFS